MPIVFLSSASDNMNTVMAMNMGGDDFMAKPFDPGVLVAKIQAILRRTYDFGRCRTGTGTPGSPIKHRDGTLTYENQVIDMTKNEYRILFSLMQQKAP